MGRDGNPAILLRNASSQTIVEGAKSLENLREDVMAQQIATAKQGPTPAAVGLLGFRLFTVLQRAKSVDEASRQMLAELEGVRAGLEAQTPSLR